MHRILIHLPVALDPQAPSGPRVDCVIRRHETSRETEVKKSHRDVSHERSAHVPLHVSFHFLEVSVCRA